MADLAVKKVPALSRVPRGHWRNLYYWPPGNLETPRIRAALEALGMSVADAFRFYGGDRHPSREVAEHVALMDLARINDGASWLDAEFFPEV